MDDGSTTTFDDGFMVHSDPVRDYPEWTVISGYPSKYNIRTKYEGLEYTICWEKDFLNIVAYNPLKEKITLIEHSLPVEEYHFIQANLPLILMRALL